MKIWLIGAGLMAQDYAKVLVALGRTFEVIGRGEKLVGSFPKHLSKKVRVGGVKKVLNELGAPDVAIIAVGVADLASSAIALIKAGTKRVLIEKPGGIDLKEIDELNHIAMKFKASVLLGYNRRFYSSTIKARELIRQDGGLLSTRFEFTEWSHVVGSLETDLRIKERWLLANSSHVIDLAFHFSGKPSDFNCWHSGSLGWHKTAARFCGSGMTEKGVLFSYFADWESAGRWGLELFTSKHRIILSPMEKLQVMLLGSTDLQEMELDDALDRNFKPGLYLQTVAFLLGDDSEFCTLKSQVENAIVYSKMAGYD